MYRVHRNAHSFLCCFASERMIAIHKRWAPISHSGWWTVCSCPWNQPVMELQLDIENSSTSPKLSTLPLYSKCVHIISTHSPCGFTCFQTLNMSKQIDVNIEFIKTPFRRRNLEENLFSTYRGFLPPHKLFHKNCANPRIRQLYFRWMCYHVLILEQ